MLACFDIFFWLHFLLRSSISEIRIAVLLLAKNVLLVLKRNGYFTPFRTGNLHYQKKQRSYIS